jgi:histidine triad (HIT) family protein
MDDCVFCKIARGEIPSQRVLEDDSFLAFNDIDPRAPVHILVIPREHLRSLDEVDGWRDSRGHELLAFAVRAAREAGINESGYRVVTNIGADAGQEVDHLHLHVLGGGPLGGFW